MLIGLNPPKSKTSAPQDAAIFDVDVASFEKMVIAGSAQRPILIEFWAPWCGPCKQLMPILEKVIAAQNCKIALAKVNIDENPELAQAFRVQSVPMVVVMVGGQPVTAFAGARPAQEIEALVAQLLAHVQKNQPQVFDSAAALKEARDHMAQSRYAEAGEIYAYILQQEPEQAEAAIGLIRSKVFMKKLDEAAALITNANDVIRKDKQFTSVVTALNLMQQTPQGDRAVSLQKMAAAPQDCDVLFYHAVLCFAGNLKKEAVETLLMILRINRNWEDGKARAQLLKYIEAWGPTDPVGMQARRGLSALLFS